MLDAPPLLAPAATSFGLGAAGVDRLHGTGPCAPTQAVLVATAAAVGSTSDAALVSPLAGEH